MRPYRDAMKHRNIFEYSVDQRVYRALSAIDRDSDLGVWKLICYLQTSTKYVNQVVGVLVNKQLVTIIVDPITLKPRYRITDKGKRLLVLLDKRDKMFGI